VAGAGQENTVTEHYIRTGTYVCGDEMLIVSDEYLDHLLPSKAELISGGVGGLCLGSGSVWLTTGWLFNGPIWLTVSFVLITAGVIQMRKHYTLRRKRLDFLRSVEATSIQ
jgi:hypothetical protein